MKKLLLMFILFSICAGSLAQPKPAYILDNTEVLTITSEKLKRDYNVLISFPASYKTSTHSYPAVFVTDADYAFPLARSIAARVGNKGRGLEEFILIGLSYAKGETPEFSRRRDYTPGPSLEANLTSDMPGRTPVFGEAENYRRFIAEEIFPLLTKHYRIDMNRKVFAGHSYGSLLGLHTLLTETSMFSHYILGSPSLWYGERVMFEREKKYASTHNNLKAKVFFAVGALETGAGKIDMVGDVKNLNALMKSRGYSDFQSQLKVVADEDHLTVAPAIMTRGLKWALPGKPQ